MGFNGDNGETWKIADILEVMLKDLWELVDTISATCPRSATKPLLSDFVCDFVYKDWSAKEISEAFSDIIQELENVRVCELMTDKSVLRQEGNVST